MATQSLASRAPRRRRLSTDVRNTINGLLFALPWLLGLSMFWIYPILASAYYSFTDFNGVQDPVWVGAQNYTTLFTQDSDFRLAVYNTLYFAVVSIPLAIVVSFGLAMLLNAKIRFQTVYRTIYFLPTLVPEVRVGAGLGLFVYPGQRANQCTF